MIPPESAAQRRMRQFGFGACCDDLRACFDLPNTHFWANDEGVLYLIAGWVESGEGRGQYFSAVLFCPFCGTSLQSGDKVRYLSIGPA